MANEMIGAGHTDCQVINGRRVVYVAAEAEAVRVTVRLDGRSRSAKVEILAPDITDGWVPTVLEAVRVDGSAESGHVGAVLTFPGGERVTIGAPEESLRASALCVEPAAREHVEIRAVREILSYPGHDGIGCTVESMARHVMDRWKQAEERAIAAERRASELEALRERAPAASASAREEPAPPPARWWQTVGAWGTREGRDTAEVVLAAPEGAWVRYPNGAQQWMTAAMLDGMTPIAAPPQPPPVEPIKYVLKVDGSPTSEAIAAAFERAVGVRLPPESDDAIIADSAFQMLAEWWGILEAAVEGEAIPTHRGITTREAVEFLYGPLRRGDPKWDRFREAFESLDGGGQGIPDPRRIGAALRRYRGRSAANGYRIAMKMDHGACRWTADSGVSP